MNAPPPLGYYHFIDADGTCVYSHAIVNYRSPEDLLNTVRASFPDAPGPLRCYRVTYALASVEPVAVEGTD